ncbi:MAG: hypothetical protein V1754_10110, partial [Pseudomonadota bacterium]
PKRIESKLCGGCHSGSIGQADELTPLFEREYANNLTANVPLRTFARQLVARYPDIAKLGYLAVYCRLSRQKKKFDTQQKDALIKRNFLVLENPPIIDGGKSVWLDMEKRSDKYLREHINAERRVIPIDDDRPIAITFLADQHIGNEGTDHRAMREDAELVARTDGMYAILGGDSWDNHIKHLAAIINAKTAPSDQIKMFCYYLSIFQHKILAVISGNHEFWTKQFSGIDIVKILTEQNKIAYHPHEFKLEVIVGKETYKIFIRHKTRFNSAFNPTHTIKQIWRMGDWDFDIGFRGDEHEATIEPFKGHGKIHWAARGGAYEILSEYAEQKGYPRALALCPTFILFPNEHEIDGYKDLHRALVPLKAARQQRINIKTHGK